MHAGARERDRRSIRLRGRDYARAGAYFVTICSQDREPLFDEPAIRAVVEQCWLSLPEHFPFVILDEWTLMPNHLHAVLFLEETSGRGVQLNAPTRDSSNHFSAISPRAGSLALVIRTYKAAVTSGCRKEGRDDFGWQRNYYEHIVRDERSLDRIREYIASNPFTWEHDENHPAHWHGDR